MSEQERISRYTLHHGDCLEVLRTLPACSVDAIVCDPPAGIAFMNKEWDKDKGGRDAWIAWMQSISQECLRVIKPGGHALVWALPRTSHWTGIAWENAGWEPRDKIVHLFGTGFPKSLDVSKAIDKAAGAKREVVSATKRNRGECGRMAAAVRCDKCGNTRNGTSCLCQPDSGPATEAAHQWEGWGTALKPAAEDWWLMRKPLDGTVASNVMQHGTGALNVDSCRVEVEGGWEAERGAGWLRSGVGADGKKMWLGTREGMKTPLGERLSPLGRWPANVVHDGSEEVVEGFPVETDKSKGTKQTTTVAENVLKHGTGALNIDACRIAGPPSGLKPYTRTVEQRESQAANHSQVTFTDHPQGRWPANVVHDGSDEVIEGFPVTTSGNLEPHHQIKASENFAMSGANQERSPRASFGGDTGTAARFFYCTKESDSDQNETCEDWWLMRKPLDGTVAENVLKHGTGGLNIDGCRIGVSDEDREKLRNAGGWAQKGYIAPISATDARGAKGGFAMDINGVEKDADYHSQGRWPANLLHDGSDEVVAAFPDSSANVGTYRRETRQDQGGVDFGVHRPAGHTVGFGDGGSAARFFYCTKASRRDREEGCEHLEAKSGAEAVGREEGSAGLNSPRAGASARQNAVRNFHPTVKNTNLMRYLCRLVTPPNGVVLDPFMGSGSTGKACMFEGFRFVGIEMEADYLEIAKARIEYAFHKSGIDHSAKVSAKVVEAKPAPKPGSSLKVLRKKVDETQIDLFAQSVAQDNLEVLDGSAE